MKQQHIQHIFDAKTAAGGVGLSLAFNIDKIQSYLGLAATVLGIIVSLATFVYVCLGIAERWREVTKKVED